MSLPLIHRNAGMVRLYASGVSSIEIGRQFARDGETTRRLIHEILKDFDSVAYFKARRHVSWAIAKQELKALAKRCIESDYFRKERERIAAWEERIMRAQLQEDIYGHPLWAKQEHIREHY